VGLGADLEGILAGAAFAALSDGDRARLRRGAEVGDGR
jgi:hypothetical protein